VRVNGRSAASHFCLALLYERTDLFDEAIAVYQDVLRCNPGHPNALFNVARLYHLQGKHAEAITYFERVVVLDPQNSQTYNNLGLIYEELGDRPQAIACFERSAELDLFRPEVHMNLARALFQHHRRELSPKLSQRISERLQMALSLDPCNTQIDALLQEVESALVLQWA
jgi:tetratricopeptide (TPR) repeat protein